ncbi:MAG: beta-propeller fold lactonase family protein [Candidatus Anammoximicrobium sp.]|nr:beta-propeller fold lactonase family protein [Candidatus Anammoximicrobium sp.]
MAHVRADSTACEPRKRDWLRTLARMVCVAGIVCGAAFPVEAAAGEAPGSQGPSALAVSPDGQTGYVASADSRQVAWVAFPAGPVTRRIEVPAEPSGLTLSPDGARLIVTCAAPRSTVLVIDAATAQVLSSIPAGHTAMSPAIAPDGKWLYVCNRFHHDVAVIDLDAGAEVARVRAVREPVAAAVTPDGAAVFVANHLPNDRLDAYPVSAVVTVIDTRTRQATAIRLPHGSHSLRGLCVSPDGKYVYVTHLLSNFELVPTHVEFGWMNMNVLTVLDVRQRRVVNTVGLDESYTAAGNPWGVACTADGKSLCVSHAGTHEVSVLDAAAAAGRLVQMYMSADVGSLPDDSGQPTSQRHRIPLPGKGPRAVAVAGSTLYVAEYFSDTVAVVNLTAPPADGAEQIALGPPPQWSNRRRGELLFNDASICRQQWQSCASCHPDGRADALNWDLLNDGVGNPKNTKSMILAFPTPPSMAEGVRGTAGAAVRSGLTNILFAERPETESSAIDEYVRSLEPVPSPSLVDGRLSPAAQRGKTLFASERTGCSRCHPPPLYTDLKMHDVGSRDKYGWVDRFDTPALIEAWRTAPYLHNGLYLTVKELLVQGKHGLSGREEGLSEQELDDLVEFVLSL